MIRSLLVPSSIAALALFCATWSAPAKAAQNDISRQNVFTIGAWSGFRYTSADGALVSCGISTIVGKGELGIDISPAGGLFIYALHDRWKFAKGKADADVIIDDVTVSTGGEAIDTDVIRVLFTDPDDVAVYERLRTGQMLRIDTRSGGQTYPLAGLSEAMPALVKCASGQAPAVTAPPASAGQRATDPFDVPGATRVDKSEAMAVMANTMSKGPDDPKATFLLAAELADILPGYDVGWRDDEGVLVGTAVRGRIGAAEVDTIIGNLVGLDTARCDGKMRIEIDPPETAKDDTSTDIQAYCDGGGNGKEAHYLIYAYDKGGIMVVRLEPVSMKDPSRLIHEIYED